MSDKNLNEFDGGQGGGSNGPGNGGNNGNGSGSGDGRDPKRQSIILFLVAALVTLLMMSSFMKLMAGETEREISYNEFIRMLEAGEISSVQIGTDRVTITPKAEPNSGAMGFYM